MSSICIKLKKKLQLKTFPHISQAEPCIQHTPVNMYIRTKQLISCTRQVEIVQILVLYST